MKYYFLITAVFFLLSCNNSQHNHADNNASVPVTASDSIYKSVMKGHDNGMAKIGEIVRLRNLIKEQDSIIRSKTKDAAQLSKLDSAAQDLDNANELMNKWMQEFDPNNAGNTEEEKIAFYKKEKEKVDTVEARIENSIDRAKKALQ